jgi:archaellum component FlaC
MVYLTDATEDKLRRLIELVASKIDTRLDEVDNQLRSLGERVDGVQKGSDDIFNLQKTDMDLTKTVSKYTVTAV